MREKKQSAFNSWKMNAKGQKQTINVTTTSL